MESISYKSKLDTISNYLNEQVFNPLSELIEISYSYKKVGEGRFFNISLFGKLGGLDETSSKEDIFDVMSKFYEEKFVILNESRQEILTLGELSGKAKILLRYIEYVEKTIKLAQIGLPFEIHKFCGEIDLSQEDIRFRVQELERIEKDLFGGNVRENPEEMIDIYDNLKKIFNKKKSKLSGKEQKEFERLLLKLKNYAVMKGFDIDVSRESVGPNDFEKKYGDLLKMKISRKDYMYLFQLVFKIYDFDKAVILEDKVSFYDGDDYLGVPMIDSYAELELRKILELIVHEIETHYITLYNKDKTLGFKGPGNLQREEGLAKVFETVLMGEPYHNTPVSRSINNVLMAEVLNGEDFIRFQELFNKMKGTPSKMWPTILRAKRNYPLGYYGAQHKDTSYQRGMSQIKNYIMDGKNVRNLFLSRISFEDMGLVEEMILSGEIDKKSIRMPIMLAELILYILINSKDGKISHEGFISHIKEKYPFLEIEDFNKISKLIMNQKIALMEILNIIKPGSYKISENRKRRIRGDLSIIE